jgi:AcrR family transcriptional regulator
MAASQSGRPEGVLPASPPEPADRDESAKFGSGRRRSSKGVRTRARLLAAAKLVFERDGFLEARIVDIAETAQLAPGSFYHYFSSKEEIFRELAEAQEKRLTAPADEASIIAGAKDSPTDRVRRANRRYFERYRDEAAIMGVIEQVSRYDDHVNAARMSTMKHFVGRAERAFVEFQQSGVVDRRVDPAIAADALGAMVGRFAELWLVQGYRDYDFDEAVEQISVLWLNALGVTDESPPLTSTDSGPRGLTHAPHRPSR